MLYKEIHDKLYKYQKEGLAFLYSLHKNRKGGILADDMGLGKTVQILSFLSGMFDMDLIKTVLLVVPVSLISNWMEEVRKWTPGMHVKVFHTSSRSLEENLKTIQENGDVLITTYQMLVNRLEMLSHHRSKDFIWDIVIFDEAHKLKKPANKTTKAASVIPSKTRILLTGTPVQNNLQEMWALFSVACQGAILGSYKSFKRLYETPITKGRMKDASTSEKALGFKISENLMEIIKPYYLRRTKLDIGKEFHDSQNKENCPPNSLPHLPEKSDLVVWLYLSPLQERIYRDILSSEKIKNILLSSACPLTELTMLKSLCDHPRLLSVNGSLALSDSYNSLIQESRKLAFLVALLEKLCSDGHRTLVFCRSCKMLNIIEKVLKAKNFNFLRIDGTVKQIELRNRRVSMFQTKSDYSIMLLTTQVGGVGLNLTAANRVVIFDPSWNPATDAQAIDRVYRIGQEKNVIVYRLITCGTVEEKVFRRQVFKNSLIRQVTGDEKDPFRHFTHEQLKDVFTLGNTELSLTQIQLQSMSITQSTRNAELEEHIAFLQSLDIFGISHTNLVFSMAQEGIWDTADGEKISLKVQKAQKTLESESLQQECGVGRLSLERGVGRNHQVSSTKEMKRPKSSYIRSSSCGLHYLAMTEGNSDGDRNFNHGTDEELDPENGDGISCSCSSLTVSEPLSTSSYLSYVDTTEEHSEINLQNQLYPQSKNTPEPTNSTDHLFKMIEGRSESNMKINSVMVEEPCVNSTPHSFHETPSTETLNRSSDLHMTEMTGESSDRKKSSSAKAELYFKCANNESHSVFSVASANTSSRSSDPHVVDVIRERNENDVKVSSEMVEESSLKSHSVISKWGLNTTFTESPNSSPNLHFFHVIESSKCDTKIGSGTDNSHPENVARTPCTLLDTSAKIPRNSAGLPYIGAIEGNSENISSVLEEKSHIQNVDNKPCSWVEGTLTEVLSSSSVLHYAGTKKQNSGDKKIRSIIPEKSFLQIVDSTPHNRSETTSTETQSNLPNIYSFQKKGGSSENEMKISNVTMEESDLQNFSTTPTIAVHQLNCFDTTSADPLGKSFHTFFVDVIQGSAHSNQKMTDITPENSCLQNVDSTIDSRLNCVSTELPSSSSGLHYDGVLGRKSDMTSRNATGERSRPLFVDSIPHNLFKTTLAETPSRSPSLHLVATIGDCSESEKLCSVTGEKVNLQNVICPGICFSPSAAKILSDSSDLHLVGIERETSESARKISILPLKESDPQNVSSMQQSEFNTVSSNVPAGTTSCCESGGPAFENILSSFNKLIIKNNETAAPTTTQNEQQNFGLSGMQDDENSIISPTFCNDSFSLENKRLSYQLFPNYQDFSIVLTSTPRPEVASGTRQSEVFPKGHFLLEDSTAIDDSTQGCSIDLSCDRDLQKVSGDKLTLLDYSATSKCIYKLADKMFPYNTGSPKFSDSEIQQKQERHFCDNAENDNEKRNKTPLGFKHHDSLFRSQPSCSDLKWESNLESPASSSSNFTKSKRDFEEGFNSDVPCGFHLILDETQPAGRQTENVLQSDTFHNFLASAQGVHQEGVSDIEDISMQHTSKLRLPLQHIVSVNSFEEKQQQPKKEKERSFCLKPEDDITGTEIPTSLHKHYETDSSLDKISEAPCEQEGASLFNSTRTLAKNQFNLQSNHESKLGIPKRCLIM
ncbi:ERC6L protein, partial [Polypterus senegalus]|nr:ERC6L protein [Polypterus senegalus]